MCMRGEFSTQDSLLLGPVTLTAYTCRHTCIDPFVVIATSLLII
jgi:hypothetical protein